MRTLAVLTVRNEAAFLLEWLAHHRVVGITDFLVYSNDCEDGTDVMLDRLQEMGVLTHVRNSRRKNGSVQLAAMAQARNHALTAKADWILPMDVDEFVNIHIGGRKLADLFKAIPDATAITLTWRLFGNSGVVNYADEPILQQFTRAAPIPCYYPWKAALFKTLYRNDKTYKKLGIHRPLEPDKNRLKDSRWFDGSGRPLPESYKTKKAFSNFFQVNNELVQLNHYPLGAKQSYLLKRHRGRAVHWRDKLGIDYWVERDFNQVEDRSILALWPEIMGNLAELKEDKVLAGLHQKGSDWRHGQFDRLMLDENYRQLYGQLMLCAPTQALSSEVAQEIMDYGRATMGYKS